MSEDPQVEANMVCEPTDDPMLQEDEVKEMFCNILEDLFFFLFFLFLFFELLN